jgi:hypothetical protein
VIEKNRVVTDPNAIAANLVASVQQLDLSIVQAVAAAAGVTDVDVGGIMKGRLIVDVQKGGSGSIRTEENFGITDFHATGPQLNGDTFRSARVDLPLNISRAPGSNQITIKETGIRSDIATVAITGGAATVGAGEPGPEEGALAPRAWSTSRRTSRISPPS